MGWINTFWVWVWVWVWVTHYSVCNSISKGTIIVFLCFLYTVNVSLFDLYFLVHLVCHSFFFVLFPFVIARSTLVCIFEIFLSIAYNMIISDSCVVTSWCTFANLQCVSQTATVKQIVFCIVLCIWITSSSIYICTLKQQGMYLKDE